MNSALIAAAARSKPEVVWLEKGTGSIRRHLKMLRDHARFLVHYNTDDVFGAGSWFWLHRRGSAALRSSPDDQPLECPGTSRAVRGPDASCRNGVRSGFSSAGPGGSPGSEEADVVFVGHWEPHTERYVAALRDAGVRMQVWGDYWWKAKDRSLRVVKLLEHEEYVTTIASAKMALCVFSRRNRNESTGRSFEIPAIGTCMLAERTAEHVFLYGERGRGAVLGRTGTRGKSASLPCEEKTRLQWLHRARALRAGPVLGDHVRRDGPW